MMKRLPRHGKYCDVIFLAKGARGIGDGFGVGTFCEQRRDAFKSIQLDRRIARLQHAIAQTA
jgi:hypothetical protein